MSNSVSDLHRMLERAAPVRGFQGPIDLFQRFSDIKDKAGTWLSKLGKNGYEHSLRLEDYLDRLTERARQDDKLRPEEAFLLLCAVYMHDIGYLVDGRLESDGHPDRSRDMILSSPQSYLLGDFPCMPGKPPLAAEAVAWVCYGHADETIVPLNDIPTDFADRALSNQTLNLRKLVALLRLADEADDPYLRLVDGSFHPVRAVTPLVKIGDETIAWHWKKAGQDNPDLFLRHLEDKKRLLVTSTDYLRDLGQGYWYLVLYPQVPRGATFMAEAPVETFVGRDSDIEALHRIIQGRRQGAITGVVGTGGIGKTELARMYAAKYRHEYPGGVFWASLKDSGWKQQGERIAGHLRPGAAPTVFPDDARAKDEVTRLLNRRGALLIIDNVTEADQIIQPDCFLLVTSRHKDAFGILPHDAVHRLDRLSVEEGVDLLGRIAGADRVADDRKGAERIVEILGRMPLAVEIAAKHLADAPSLSFPDYIGEINGKIEELKLEGLPDKDVMASLQLSLEQLEGIPDGAKLVALFEAGAVCAASGFMPDTLGAAAGLASAGRVKLARWAGKLHSRSLLDFDDKSGRYSMHPLLRQLAEARAGDSGRLDTFEKNHCKHFLGYAESCKADPARLIAETDGLWQAMIQAIQTGRSETWLPRLLDNVSQPYRSLVGAGRWEEAFAYLASTNLINVGDLGQSRLLVGLLELLLSQEAHLREETRGVLSGRMGSAHFRLGDCRKALELHGQALDIARSTEDAQGEANALGNMGSAHFQLGDYGKAIELYEQRLEIARRIGDVQGEGYSLVGTGIVHGSLGDYRKALELYEEALEISRRTGDVQGEGGDLGNMGEAYLKLDEHEKAMAFLIQAERILGAIGSPDVKTVENNMERLRRKLGEAEYSRLEARLSKRL